MDRDLDPVEVRVLGCLIEKQRTTPDQYPLSLNALRSACNQTTNRNPIVSYDEELLRNALQKLGRRRYTRLASGHTSRAAKYRHLLDEALPPQPVRGPGPGRRARGRGAAGAVGRRRPAAPAPRRADGQARGRGAGP